MPPDATRLAERSIGDLDISDYVAPMTTLNISMPPALQNWVDAQVAQGRYADAADYLRDLVRRDRREASDERLWLKAMIDEGLASGVLDAEPEDVLDAIIAEDPDLRG